MVFGPTLLDLANHLSVGVGSLAIMFAVRALGGAAGSVGSGVILDKAKRHSYTFMCFVIFTGIASEWLSLDGYGVRYCWQEAVHRGGGYITVLII